METKELLEIKLRENRDRHLKWCHKLREETGGLTVISDERLILYALKMYERSKLRILKNREKKKCK